MKEGFVWTAGVQGLFSMPILFFQYLHTDSGKKSLFSWKMSDRRSLSPLFAAVCDGVLKTGFGEGCVLVPVPPRAGKIRRRGWDQIDELCRYLRFFYGYKVLYLLRRLSTVQQKKLDRSHRLSGIGKAYTLSSKGRAFCDKKRCRRRLLL